METVTQIKDRIAALAATMPLDADPLAEARAEQRAEKQAEKRLGIVLEQGGENPGLRNMTPQDLEEHPEWIKVGMGATSATALGGLYRALTVIDVRRGGKELDVQYDKVTVVTKPTGWEDNGEKLYEADPTAEVQTITRRKDRTYIVKGQPMGRWQTRFRIGYRRDWMDFSQ